jgi:hypothetical protein
MRMRTHTRHVDAGIMTIAKPIGKTLTSASTVTTTMG